MNSRHKILNQLRTNGRAADLPGPWRSRRQFDDLAGRFDEALTAAKGECHHAASLDAAVEQLHQLLRELNAARIVVNAEPPLTELDLPARWPDFQWHAVGQSDGDLRAFCASADVGLSGADAALAETGSVIVSSGPGRSRLATLLPEVHLALVPVSCLTADIFTWTAGRQGELPANQVIVSGPSKTGDIEQTMAIGVHGPKRFIVILYQD